MTFENFSQYPNLQYGISSKSDGSMKLALGGEEVLTNRNKFFLSEKINPAQVISAMLAHSNRVASISVKDSGKTILNVDALVTSNAKQFLALTVADCFPMYLFDPVKNIAAIAHCGWRGIVSDLIYNTVVAMKSSPRDVLVGIGPGIQVCHFEVKSDILSKFKNYEEAITRKDNKIFIDLPNIIIAQLLKAGILKYHIENFGECTYCLPDKYFSYRRDKPEDVEAQVAFIGMLKLK